MSDITTKTKCRCGIELGDHNTIDLLYCLMNGIKLFDTLSEIHKKNVADLRQAESERDRLREEIRMLAEKADMLWHPDYEIEETVYDEYCNERDRILALAAVPEDESDVVESSYNEWFRMHQNDVAVPEERKTCRWTIFENTIRRVTYRTDCGLQYEWDKEDVKPIVCECGLPIEDVKNEEEGR